MLKKTKNALLGIFLLVIVITFPFCIEKILLNETIFPFNLPIKFSRESWFGFIASYLGAIGTVILGIIALYQNKKYKELSDQSESRFLQLQEDIKELTQKNVDLIELNTKLERAKYYPILTNLHHTFWNIREKNLKQSFSPDEDAFQITYKKDDPYEMEDTVNDVFNHYFTFTCTFKNDSERTIRNFNCSNIIINNDEHGMGFWQYQSCDIEPGTILRCVYATKFDLAEHVLSGTIESLSFTYNMENVIGEQFQMSMDVHFYQHDESYPNPYIETTPILRIE